MAKAKKKTTKRPQTNSRTGTLFIRKISIDAKAQFKAWCIRRGLTMTEVIEDFMIAKVAEQNKG